MPSRLQTILMLPVFRKVGIKEGFHPFSIRCKTFGKQITHATFKVQISVMSLAITAHNFHDPYIYHHVSKDPLKLRSTSL